MFTASDTARILDVATQGGDIEGRLVAMAEVLTNILGSCNTPLEHRANVTIKGDLTIDGDIIGATIGYSYAVATATWVRASGDGSYVTCRAASDPTGTLTSDATTFTVYLPRWISSKDPNVYSGDVLQYVTIGGTNYAVGESYLDDKIGTLRAMTIGTEYNGWELCDGTGSTEDHTNLFVRGAVSYGTTGGANTHSHTGSTTIANASLTITGSTASGSANISDHPDHRHLVQDVFCQTSLDGGAVYFHADTDVIYTQGMVDIGGSTPITYSHTDTGHTHGVGTLAIAAHNHTGTITINNGDNVPAYIEVVWFVRVGPSGEIS